MAGIAVIAGSANAETTLTLTPPTGKRVRIWSLRIGRNSTDTLAGSASLLIATTNLNSATFQVGNLMADAGTENDVNMTFPDGLDADAVTTAVTFVMPAAGAAVLWNAQAVFSSVPPGE